MLCKLRLWAYASKQLVPSKHMGTCILHQIIIFSLYRDKALVCAHPVSRKPSQQHSHSDIPCPNGPKTGDKHHSNPYVPGLHDAEPDDLGHIYDTTLTASLHATSCPNLPGMRNDWGEESIPDTEEYEVMLTTGANPAYKHVQHPASNTTEDVQLAGIYEQLS